VRVVSSEDVEPAAAAPAAESCGSTAATDFSAALQDDVDTVIISTPNSQHRPQAVAAIEAGKHVLLQKPVAANLADAEAIAAAAAKSTRTVGLYMSYFDQPLMHDLRDMVAQGRLGDVVHCYARLMHKGGMMWSEEALKGHRTWRGSVAETGGGCFIQLAVHYIHIFQWITGGRVVKAAGFTRNLHCPGLEGEDLAVAILELDSGAMITLDTAWCRPLADRRARSSSRKCVRRASAISGIRSINTCNFWRLPARGVRPRCRSRRAWTICAPSSPYTANELGG
jgi:1,5-anhydro-D-fructose reductase (1,5-anhydro-D-mannitol-forming)